MFEHLLSFQTNYRQKQLFEHKMKFNIIVQMYFECQRCSTQNELPGEFTQQFTDRSNIFLPHPHLKMCQQTSVAFTLLENKHFKAKQTGL